MNYFTARQELYTTSTMTRKAWSKGEYCYKGMLDNMSISGGSFGIIYVKDNTQTQYIPSEEDINATDWDYYN